MQDIRQEVVHRQEVNTNISGHREVNDLGGRMLDGREGTEGVPQHE